MRTLTVVALIGVAACGGEAADGPLELTLIANAGFLLATPGHRVLVDAVFGSTEGPEIGWAPRPEVLAAIEAAAAPFDRIDAVLVTHDHLDHFDAVSIGRLLASAPDAVLVCPAGLAAAMRAEVPAVADRIRGLSAAWGKSAHIKVDGVSITALGLPHAGGDWLDYDHHAYVVELDGRKVLHLGDAVETTADYEPFAWLADAGIDVALVAPWQIQSPEMIAMLDRTIRPRQMVLMHARPHAVDSTLEEFAAIRGELPPLQVVREKMASLVITD